MFKVGDRVQALKDLYNGVCINDIGVVVSVWEENRADSLLDIKWIQAKTIPYGTVYKGWGARRFRKAPVSKGAQLKFSFMDK